MKRTDNFRRQHGELLQAAEEISRQLNKNTLAEHAVEIRQSLAMLSGKLKVHLTMEDESLYPSLAKSSDTRVSTTAGKYIEEMGHIKKAFEEYTRNWPTPQSIQSEPEKFIKETKAMFGVLEERIARENNKLYNLMDEME